MGILEILEEVAPWTHSRVTCEAYKSRGNKLYFITLGTTGSNHWFSATRVISAKVTDNMENDFNQHVREVAEGMVEEINVMLDEEDLDEL